jgi:membrane protein
VDVLGWIDGVQQRRRWLAFPYAVIRKFSDDQGGNQAGLLAYYAFLSVFPLLLTFSTVLGYVLRGNPGLQQRLLDSALAQFPVIGPQLRTNTLHGHWYVLVFSLLVSLWGARGVAATAQAVFNTLWAVPYVHRPGFWTGLGRSFGLLAVIGVSALSTGLLSGIGSQTGAVGVLVRAAALAAATAINITAFGVGFRLATAAAVRTRELVVGAVVSGVLWQALLTAGSLLVAHQVRHATQLYGTFGVVLGLIGWLHLQAQLTLFAIEADIVRVRRLWPRSVAAPPLTRADQRAYRAETAATQRRPSEEEHIDVTFHHPPGGEESGKTA